MIDDYVFKVLRDYEVTKNRVRRVKKNWLWKILGNMIVWNLKKKNL